MTNNENQWQSLMVTPESVADFQIDDATVTDPFSIDDDDDIMIEPDEPIAGGSSNNNNNNNNTNSTKSSDTRKANLFDFNYANPFNSSFSTNLNNEINSTIQVRERQFTGGNTLDESVLVTIKRDLNKIGDKLLQILWPIGLRHKLQTVQNFTSLSNNNSGPDQEVTGMSSEESEQMSKESIMKILDWDLWGPLVITLLFSLILTFLQIRSLDPKYETKASKIFSASFTLIWASLFVLSLNIQLLSPFHDKSVANSTSKPTISLSIFQSVSILGYSIFPIMIGAVLSILIPFKIIRIVLFLVLLAWSIYSTYLIIKIVNNSGANEGKGDDRLFLIIYPIGLVFGVLSWLCVIS